MAIGRPNPSPETGSEYSDSTFLLISAWLGSTLLFTTPGNIYLANSGDFTLDLAVFFKFTTPLFIIGMGVAYAFYRVVPKQIRCRLTAFLFALAVLLWAQGNLLIWNYGPLDGRTIAWEEYSWQGWFDSAIWVAVIVFSIFAPQVLLRPARTFSSIVLGASILLLCVYSLQQPTSSGSASIKNFQIEDANKFSFSADRNVVLVVLDAFQSDVFSEVVNDRAYADEFDGFTYFPNALAGSNFTQLSVPNILTGTLYDNRVPRSEYMRDSFLEYSVTTLLKRAGFSAEIYPWVGWGNETIYFDEVIASNLILKENTENTGKTYSEKNAKEVLHLVDLALFRSAPHFLKRFIYNDQRWLTIQIATALVPTGVKQSISNDNQFETNIFVQEAVRRIDSNNQLETFKYYHVKGAHRPLSVDADLNFVSGSVPFDRQNYIRSVKANIKAIAEFLDALKASKVYENTLIILVGDHGSGNSPDVYIEPGQEGTRIDGTTRNFQKDKARGVPLVLVKRIGASGAITVNNAPVSLADIPATIYAELRVEAMATGRSVFDIGVEDSAGRTYSAFDYSATHSDYVGPLTEYEVRGHSWLDSSWSVLSIQHPGGIVPDGSDAEDNVDR